MSYSSIEDITHWNHIVLTSHTPNDLPELSIITELLTIHLFKYVLNNDNVFFDIKKIFLSYTEN